MTKRSVWKGPFFKEEFFNEIRSIKSNKIKTSSRNSVVLPFLINRVVQVHNGKFFIPVLTLFQCMHGRAWQAQQEIQHFSFFRRETEIGQSRSSNAADCWTRISIPHFVFSQKWGKGRLQ